MKDNFQATIDRAADPVRSPDDEDGAAATAEILNFTGVTKLDLPAETVLNRAAGADLSCVLVIGWDADKALYAASSTSHVGNNLELVEVFKHKLISGEFGE